MKQGIILGLLGDVRCGLLKVNNFVIYVIKNFKEYCNILI